MNPETLESKKAIVEKIQNSFKDSASVVITRGDTKIEITLGSDIMKVNGKESYRRTAGII